MFKTLLRTGLTVLVALALGLGMTALAGSAGAASSASACASQHTAVHKAKHHVAKDKSQLKKAKRHHHKSAVKKAKKKLARDRAKLAQARSAYRACMNPSAAPAPAPAPAPTPAPAPVQTPNPITEQCLTVAGQLAAQDPTGSLGSGATAFCGLLGQVTGALGGDPVAACNQLAAADPTGQFDQLCAALGSAPSLPGLPGTDGLPGLPGLPGTSGGLIGTTLEGVCDLFAAQDPTGQLQQVCTGLGSLPI